VAAGILFASYGAWELVSGDKVFGAFGFLLGSLFAWRGISGMRR